MSIQPTKPGFLQRLRPTLWGPVVALLVLCTGCTCSNDVGSGLAPLEERALTPPSGVRIAVPLGARDARQVLLLFVGREEACAAWKPEHIGGRFLLCTHAPPDAAEAAARRGLQELKRVYGAHVAPPPVLLVAEEARVEVGRSLFLSEPAFFAHVVVFTPSLAPFDTTALNAFGEQGGRSLVLVSPDTTGLDRLQASLGRLPLHFERLEPGPQARARALLVSGRPIVGPPAPSAPRSEAPSH